MMPRAAGPGGSGFQAGRFTGPCRAARSSSRRGRRAGCRRHIRWSCRPDSPGPSEREAISRAEGRRQPIELRIGIVALVQPPTPLYLQPLHESGRLGTTGSALSLRRLDGKVVGVLVLRVPLVAPHPGELYVVIAGAPDEFLPELEILDGAALPAPAARLPAGRPFADTLHQVFGVRDNEHPEPLPLGGERGERRDGAGQCHAVVGGGRFGDGD